jgi:hypothetical protein
MASQTHSKGGRPSKYDEKYVDELIEYFESFVDKPYTKEVMREETTFDPKTGNKKSRRVEFKFVSKRLPTLFGFARKINVQYRTVYNWAHARVGDLPKEGEPDRRPYKYPEFFQAYKAAALYQTEFLTAVGLGGIAPSPFAIFTSKNVIGWRDAVDQRFVDGDGKDRKVPGYVLLPARKTDQEALEEFDQQNLDSEDTTPTIE